MPKKKKNKKTKFPKLSYLLSKKQFTELKQAEKSLLDIKDMLLKAKEVFDGYQQDNVKAKQQTDGDS